jgi:hypothetical protein
MLIAADRLAGGPVQMGQAADTAADHNGLHGGAARPTWGAIWAGPSRWVQPSCTTLSTSRVGCAVGCGGAAGPVGHPSRALLLVALGPPMRGGPATLEPLGRPSHGPALVHNGPGQPQPAELTQAVG